MDVNALMNFKDSNGTNNVVYPITKKSNVIGLEQDLTNMASSINSATQAVAGKVDKIEGKGLSTEDFTTAEKTKLAGIEAGATVVTVDSELSNTSTNPVQNKVVYSALGGKVDKVTGKALSTNDFTDALKSKLDGVDDGANNYVHPATSGNKHIPSGGSAGKILGWASDGTAQWVDDHNTEYSDATTSAHGLMSAADKTKLDGIASGATAVTVDSGLSSSSENPVQNKVINSALDNKVDKITGKGLSTNDFTDAYKADLDGLDNALDGKADVEDLTAAQSQLNSLNDELSALSTTVSGKASSSDLSALATTVGGKADTTYVNTELAKKVDKVSGKGLSTNDFTNAFKNKLDGIEDSANNYVHPTTSGSRHVPSGGSAGKILGWASDGTAQWVDNHGTEYPDASTSEHGLMSVADKTKLDGIEDSANNYVHPTTSGSKHIPSGGSAGKILGWASDGTAQWVDDHNTEYSDATTSTHGLMSAADKSKLNGISAGAEKIYDIDVSKLDNFDPDDISVALNSIVSSLTQGKRIYLPYGEYNVRNPIILHAPDFCTFHLFGRIHNYVSGNCFSIGGSFCEFIFDDLRSSDIGTAILVNKNFSYSRLRIRYIDHFANGLVFKMSAGREDFVQYSKINFEFISNIVNKCIWIDGTTYDGWVNENTFVGGRLKGGYGIYINGGTTESGVGFDGNKFYNIGFEEIDNDGVYINGETYSNVFLHCRAMEGIGTHLINEVSEQLGHNQFYFDCVVPNDKIIINGHRTTYHGTIANQYTQWIAGGKDKDGLLPHNAKSVIYINDVDKTETINANANKKIQYGIPGVERYEPIMIFVKTHSTQDGSDYRYTDVKITNFDKDNGLFDVVYSSTLGYAVELHMTYRIIYKWIG